MTTPPPETPVTVVGEPAEPIVAMLVLLVLHVPPEVASAREAVPDWHTVADPRIAPGTVQTLTVVVV